MPTKRIKLTSLMLRGPISPGLIFVTMTTAAELLEVHPGHVSRLLDQGELQRVELVDLRGRVLASGVQLESIDVYRKHQRRKRQLDLLAQVK